MSEQRPTILNRISGAVRTWWSRAEAGVHGMGVAWQVLYGAGANPVTQPLAQCAWVYSAVRAIAQTIAQLAWRLERRGRPGEALESGPAYELFTRPATGLTAAELFEQLAGHLVEGGEVTVFDPLALGELRLRQIAIAGRRELTPRLSGDGRRVLYWEYRAPGWTGLPLRLAPELVARLRLFNPYDPLRGLSPLEAAALGIAQDYRAAQFNEAALANGGAPGGLLVFPENVSREQAREALREFEDAHRGERNANKVRVIGGGVDYKQVAFKNTDLELVAGRRFNREEIFAAFGVPPVLGNVFDSAHYNVADAAQEIFLVNTIQPLVAKISDFFDVLILPRVEAGVRLILDLASHHVLRKIERSKADTLAKLVENGIPRNEAVAFLGLPFTPQPWGEQAFLRSGLETPENLIAGGGTGALPADETPADETPADETPAAGGQQDSEFRIQNSEFSASLAAERKAEEAQMRAQVPRIRQRFRAFFLRQERELLRRLRRALAEGAAAGRSVSLPWERAAEPEAERIVRRILLRIAEEQGKLRALLRDYFPRALAETLRAELKRLGYPAGTIEKVVRKARDGKYIQGVLKIKASKIAGLEATTRGRLQRSLVEGLGKGETMTELSQRVHEVLGGDRYRALRIARTEAGEAVSTARFVAAAAAGAEGKGWIAGRNPRPAHEAAGLTYNPRVSPIPLHEAFDLAGAKLMYPRDPAGPAGQIINCNCVLVTVRLKKQAGAGRGAQDAAGWELVNALGLARADGINIRKSA